MLHELLFALNGNHGSVFALDHGRFRVNPALPLFHPSEASLLESLLELGEKYWRISSFIRLQESPKRSPGLYMEALCEGLDLVLEAYRSDLRALEKAILYQNHMELSHFSHVLSPHEPVLTALSSLISHVQIQKAKGVSLLDMIYKASYSGSVSVEKAMKKLLHVGHRVMYKQLLAWLLHGMTCDHDREFFIVEEDDAGPSHPLDGPQRLQCSGEDPHSSSELMSSKAYRLRPEALPSYISFHTAEKIFFVGESVQLFELDRRLELQGSVLKERESEFYEELSALRDCEEFRVSDFERFIDDVRCTTSRHLHHLVLHRSNLRSELRTARDFFLLARGELYQVFIQVAELYLKSPVSATTKHDTSQAFMNAIRGVMTEDDHILKKIQIDIEEGQRLQGWSGLCLKYSVPWPLHLIFTPTALEQYNKIFQFLILVKRTQLKLHECWAKEMTAKRVQKSWRLRFHMIFIVDNLQHYLMADVLDSQFSILWDSLEKTEDFEALKASHQDFLNTICFNIFIHDKPIYECLVELLKTCIEYSDTVDNMSEDKNKKIALKFAGLSSSLFQILKSLNSKNHHRGSHLTELLLRIDYNRYFLNHGHSIE